MNRWNRIDQFIYRMESMIKMKNSSELALSDLKDAEPDEKVFLDCINEVLCGRMHPDVAAYLTGLSRPTFYKRFNQYFDPQLHGELPEDFFNGRKVP